MQVPRERCVGSSDAGRRRGKYCRKKAKDGESLCILHILLGMVTRRLRSYSTSSSTAWIYCRMYVKGASNRLVVSPRPHGEGESQHAGCKRKRARQQRKASLVTSIRNVSYALCMPLADLAMHFWLDSPWANSSPFSPPHHLSSPEESERK